MRYLDTNARNRRLRTLKPILARRSARPERCSDCTRSRRRLSVLFVGPERPDEFHDALRLLRRGHCVLAVNPRETAAARVFQCAGGMFFEAQVEELPIFCRRFDLICENYPYPSGRGYVPARPFAVARLRRLARGGRWILFTEAVRFATLLKAVADYDDKVSRDFQVRFSEIAPESAPHSHYPPTNRRFRLIFERRR